MNEINSSIIIPWEILHRSDLKLIKGGGLKKKKLICVYLDYIKRLSPFVLSVDSQSHRKSYVLDLRAGLHDSTYFQ